MTSIRDVSASFRKQSIFAIQTAPEEATNCHLRDLVKLKALVICV